MSNNYITVIADGLELNKDISDKINQIEVVTKKVSKKPQINIKLVKNGFNYEGLLWGKLDQAPIGAFSHGHSPTLVLENLCKRVKRDCLKILQERVRHQEFDYYENSNLAQVS